MSASPVQRLAAGGPVILSLEWSQRVTPSISLHRFAVMAQNGVDIQPCQHITLQFPEDFDPVLGATGLTKEHRLLSFTPADIAIEDSRPLKTVTVLSTNGRVSGLMGLPRPKGPLKAELVEVGGGFPRDKLARMDQRPLCIAGGTGLACFLALASSRRSVGQERSPAPRLFWSIRQDDFKVVEYLYQHGLLTPRDWSVVHIFVTSGTLPELASPSSAMMALEKKINDDAEAPGRASISARRMSKGDVIEAAMEHITDVFFCGSKSFEWQVKMWCFEKAQVHCTAPPW